MSSRRVAAALKGSAAQQGIVFGTHPTTKGIIVALRSEPTVLSTPTLGTDKAVRVQMPLQPDQAQAIVKQIGDRKINHVGLPLTARLVGVYQRSTVPGHAPTSGTAAGSLSLSPCSAAAARGLGSDAALSFIR